MDDLTGEFIAETRETLASIAEALVAWEADPSDTARLDEMLRFVHTVKGSCGFLDLARIEALAHAAETVMVAIRNGTRPSDKRLVGALLRVIDRISLLIDALDTDAEFPPIAGDRQLIAGLDEPDIEVLPEPDVEATKSRARNIRVAVDLLDAMMSQVSDLVLVRNDLARQVRTPRGDSTTEITLDRLSTSVADLRDSIARARMQSVERLFAALPRLVRDTANTLHKDVELTITGSHVELDREMVEQLRDPLLHMVRNAIDHGIEFPAERKKAGKPARATLRVEARQSGNQIAITVADDGRGIDCARLRNRAVEAGVIDARTVLAMDDIAAANLIFMPGLSTAATVTAVSGRGVGMDIVRSNMERLGGTITVDNQPGAGLTVELRAPLTLSIVGVLSISAGGRQFAVPRATVDEVLSLHHGSVALEAVGDGFIARIRGKTLPVVSLALMTGSQPGNPGYLVVIDNGAGQQWAIAADAVGDHEEVVIRPVAPVVAASGLFAGQALPDDGNPLLVLDVLGLARIAQIEARSNGAQSALCEPVEAPVALILFSALDGKQRAIPVSAVERIVDIPRTAITAIGDSMIVNEDGLIYSAVIEGDLPPGKHIAMLRLARGSERLGLIVQEPQDLIQLAADRMILTAAGPVAIIDERVVAIVDPDELFDAASMPIPRSPAALKAAA